MTQNQLYAQCREEAISILLLKYGNATYLDTERQQLTAEIYGMKLLQMDGIRRVTFAMHRVDPPIISPQQLHDHLVEQFNKEEWK